MKRTIVNAGVVLPVCVGAVGTNYIYSKNQAITLLYPSFFRTVLKSPFLITLLTISFACVARAGVAIGPSGSGVITFLTAPAVSDWSTRSLAGTDDNYPTAASLDAAVNGPTNAASTIINPLIDLSPTNPPAQNALAVWTSGGNAYVQTRPTGIGATELMATLQNDTGSNVTGLTISYTLAAAGTARSEQVASHQVYYSLTGAAGSWTKIAGLSDATAGTVNGVVPFPGTWAPGSVAYLLWVDDNSTNGTDNAWTIDNVSIGAGVGTFQMAVTLTSPTNTQHFTSAGGIPANVPIAVTATASSPVTNVAVFTNGVLAFNDGAAPYSGNVTLPIGTHRIHARGANSTEMAYSLTNTIIVKEEFAHYLGGTLTESFDSMGSTTETPVGWYVGGALPVNGSVVTVGTGSSGASSAIMGWNYGTSTSDPDRALGTAPTSTDRNIAVRIVNDTAQTIFACEIRYDGEVWRNYTNAVGGFISNMVSVDLGASWVNTGFDFEQPATTPRTQPQTAVNGHNALNRVADIGGTFLLPVPVPPGGVIYIRWHDFNDASITDGGLAINNFRFSAVGGNARPVLMPVADITTTVGVQLSVTNTAYDSDVPAQNLTFLLAAAPAGATLSSSGVLRWKPGIADAGTTNTVSVGVMDDGVPSLAATQTFRVRVRDYVSSSLGTFVVRAGDTGSIPIRIFSSAAVSRLTFGLLHPPNVLSNPAVTPLAPQIAYARLFQLNPSSSFVQITNYLGQTYQGTQDVALLTFSTAPGQRSGFVTLLITNVQARRVDGTLIANTVVQSGRVIIVGDEPLVEAIVRNDGQRAVIVYGQAGATYQIQSAPSMALGQPWQTDGQITLPAMSASMDVTSTNRAVFYRAMEL